MKSEKMKAVLKTIRDVKSDLGVYYSIRELNGLSDPHSLSNKTNFLRLLNLNFFLRPAQDEINFAYNFLNKAYCGYTVKIKENLNEQYFNWFGDDDRYNIAKTKNDALKMIEDKIEEIIDSVLSKNKHVEKMMAKKTFINSLLMKTDMNKKIAFIMRKKDSFKGKLSDFISVKWDLVSENENRLVKVPSLMGQLNEKGDMTVYAVRKDQIVKIDGAYIYGAKINYKNDTLSLNMEIPDIFPSVYNFPSLIYDENKGEFIFSVTEELFGNIEDAKDFLRNKIERMNESIKAISEQIAA